MQKNLKSLLIAASLLAGIVMTFIACGKGTLDEVSDSDITISMQQVGKSTNSGGTSSGTDQSGTSSTGSGNDGSSVSGGDGSSNSGGDSSSASGGGSSSSSGTSSSGGSSSSSNKSSSSNGSSSSSSSVTTGSSSSSTGGGTSGCAYQTSWCNSLYSNSSDVPTTVNKTGESCFFVLNITSSSQNDKDKFTINGGTCTNTASCQAVAKKDGGYYIYVKSGGSLEGGTAWGFTEGSPSCQ